MYENFEINERQTVPNENSKLSQSKFTKSLTLFHTKKNLSKIITQQNTIKNPCSLKQNKYSKTKRIYFSYKKAKELGYLLTNPTSPKNFKKNYNPLKTYNLPSSDQRLYKYKNKYLLNGINKYKSGSIFNHKTKKNKYKNNSIKDKKSNNKKINIDNEKNISNNNSDSNSKKANGASNINNNLNNSLVKSSENFLNTIAITLNNNENTIQSNFIRFNGLNGPRLVSSNNNKSLSNLNDFSSFGSRNKILKKIKEKNNKISKKKKKINSIKNQNINSIKKASLVKTKSKVKIKTTTKTNNKKKDKSSGNSNYISTNTNTNINKQSVNNENNNIIQMDESNKIKKTEVNINKPNCNDKNNINDNENTNIELEDSNKIKNVKSTININRPNTIISNDLLYETVDSNPLNEEFIKHFNLYNLINISSQRNNDINKEGLNTLKTLNSMKSYQQSANTSNNLNNENNINNNINIGDNNDENNKIGYQTFSGPFRKNIIKVNIIEKEKLKNNGNIKNDFIDNNNNTKKLFKNNPGTKSANNLKNTIINNNNNNAAINPQMTLHIETDNNFKNNKIKKDKNNNNIQNIQNQNEELNKNNIEMNNSSPERKTDLILNNKIIDNNSKNNIKQNKLFNSLLSSHSNLKIDKNNNSNSIINSFNFNIYPLSRDSSRTYFKNNSSTISYVNKNTKSGHTNFIGNKNKNRSIVFKQTKTSSIFTSIYTQRNNKENKLKLKNKSNKNYLNSTHGNGNKIEKHRKNSSVIVPEYKIKLENIKSRVSNLLNVYSLLALKSLNSTNVNKNEIIE